MLIISIKILETRDVSSVINMSHMFYNNDNQRPFAFNQDIGNWNVSNVKSMRNMFQNANQFNQDISKWDVSNCTDMRYMFYTQINSTGIFPMRMWQDLTPWCVENVISYNYFHGSVINYLGQTVYWPSSHIPLWGVPCASPSIAAPDQTDWTTNSTIEGQGNALNLAKSNGISIYPNPTTGIINLNPVPEGTYRFYNEIGRLIDQGKIQPRFDLSNFDNGIYMLLLQTDNESKYFKVIKQ